ncbi:hypothetical protein LINPERHAP1_LOCUS19459 [Linum perenne]
MLLFWVVIRHLAENEAMVMLFTGFLISSLSPARRLVLVKNEEFWWTSSSKHQWLHPDCQQCTPHSTQQ